MKGGTTHLNAQNCYAEWVSDKKRIILPPNNWQEIEQIHLKLPYKVKFYWRQLSWLNI